MVESKSKLYIGISGPATSGKDTLARLISQELNKNGILTETHSLAFQLKKELENFILHHYLTEVFDCTPKDKENIRPLLIFHGEIKRKMTKGKYWCEILERKFKESHAQVILIPDIRYYDCNGDAKQGELHWLKQKLGGLLIHVRKCKDGLNGEERIIPPLIKEEVQNCPLLYHHADYQLDWKAYPDLTKEDRDERLTPYLNDFFLCLRGFLVKKDLFTWISSNLPTKNS